MSLRRQPLWVYQPGSNTGIAAVGTRGDSARPAVHSGTLHVRSHGPSFATPNTNYSPEYDLTLEELCDCLANELPAAVGWVPPTEREEVVVRQLRRGKPAYEVRVVRGTLRQESCKLVPWR